MNNFPQFAEIQVQCGMWMLLPMAVFSSLIGTWMGFSKGRHIEGMLLGLLWGPAGLLVIPFIGSKPKSPFTKITPDDRGEAGKTR